MSELVNKSEVLDIWNNFWITDMTTLDAENQLRELATVELKSAPHLDEDQQQVLDWLKWSFEDQGNSSIDAIYLLRIGEAIDSVSLSYMTLTKKDQTEVLAVFSQWALEQENG